MRHALALTVLVLSFVSVSAFSADSIVGKWEGKDKEGKIQAIEFKENQTMVTTEDGKNELPEGVTMKWKIVDAAAGYIDITVTGKNAEGKEESHKMEAVFVLNGDSLKLGSPSAEGKRSASIDKCDDVLELARKK